MKEQLDSVQRFHKDAQAFVAETPTIDVPKETVDLRVKLIQEELNEYAQAFAEGNLVNVADALTDLMYVLLGTYTTHGLQEVAEELFDVVHRSNMEKVVDLKLREDGKVMKPEGYTHPDLEPILTRSAESNGTTLRHS